VADLTAAVALGGDCLADVAVLREQSGLAGPVASDPVVSRLVKTLAADLPRALKAIRAARASAPGARVGAGRGERARHGRRPGHSVGMIITEEMRTAVLKIPPPRGSRSGLRKIEASSY
jgi:hypothetical protein